jgi:hypothetical protein
MAATYHTRPRCLSATREYFQWCCWAGLRAPPAPEPAFFSSGCTRPSRTRYAPPAQAQSSCVTTAYDSLDKPEWHSPTVHDRRWDSRAAQCRCQRCSPGFSPCAAKRQNRGGYHHGCSCCPQPSCCPHPAASVRAWARRGSQAATCLPASPVPIPSAPKRTRQWS